ncbi:hypothetical protein AWW66_24240 [Micromonospora rosaria]|uniref:Uncharacterized protein n=1 Tax=Micromonospora rosaria TaxID=47874 RepID=A0A136PLS4_9ACTN|nr:hypothetical protein [Micromonospora rosaria]KXK59420.1 hypothetical protein AWW66_24240 [Micromonospora rosaria]
MRKILRQIAVGGTAAIAIVTLSATPASAASSGCKIPQGDLLTMCFTGNLSANSSNKMQVQALAGLFQDTTCQMFDASNLVQVGSVTAGAPGTSNSKTISGLYGTYYVRCTVHDTYGSTGAGGYLRHA